MGNFLYPQFGIDVKCYKGVEGFSLSINESLIFEDLYLIICDWDPVGFEEDEQLFIVIIAAFVFWRDEQVWSISGSLVIEDDLDHQLRI